MQLSNANSKAGSGGPIVLATHEYAPFRGGVATYVREIAGVASRVGYPVEVWTVDGAGRHAPPGLATEQPARRQPASEENGETVAGGVPVVRLRSNGRLTPRGLFSLAWGFWWRRSELRDRPVVLLSVGAQMAFFLLAALGLRPGGRVTCFFHGSEVPRFRRNPFWRFLARRFYRRVDAFAATTRYVADLLRESGLLPDGATVAAAPCALPEAFRADADAVRLSGTTAGTEANDPFPYRVLTVARLHPRKGQLDVAHALALLPEKVRSRVVYQVAGVGDADYRSEVEAACREGGVRCEFLGGLDDATLGTFYARATVYAQASRSLAQSVEGFGITFLEAAAYGCPAAVWRSGGVAEAVRDGETGLLVDEGDVPGLAAAIERLLTEPGFRAGLGARARIFAREFHWDASARKLCEVATGAKITPC